MAQNASADVDGRVHCAREGGSFLPVAIAEIADTIDPRIRAFFLPSSLARVDDTEVVPPDFLTLPDSLVRRANDFIPAQNLLNL